MATTPPFCKQSPCKSCPYRVDAPLQYWDRSHFADLLHHDQQPMGTVYLCHQADGTRCTGWVMDQDLRRFPSVSLRLELLTKGITREVLDGLHCKGELYTTQEDMIRANYPDLLEGHGHD